MRENISRKSIIDGLNKPTKELSLRLLSSSFKKCAHIYPNDKYLDASKELLTCKCDIFDLSKLFLSRKPYGFKIVKKHFNQRDILYGCFDVPTLMLISINNIFGDKTYDIIVLSKGVIFTSLSESGIQCTEQNMSKYMESRNCDNFRGIEVMKTLCFYGKTVEGHNSKVLSRGSYSRSPSDVRLLVIYQIDILWDQVCDYIGHDDAHEIFCASNEISLMIRRKRVMIRLKQSFDDNRHREAKRIENIANNLRRTGDIEQERAEWDRLRRHLHSLFMDHEKDEKEVQSLVSSCWSLTRSKICVALHLEGLPTTAPGILQLNERYLNNFTEQT